MAKDFFNNELNVGDTVAFMQKGYRKLLTGIIDSITDQTVLISHEKRYVGGTQTRQSHGQVIKKIN